MVADHRVPAPGARSISVDEEASRPILAMQHSGMMFPPRADRLGRTNHSVPLVHPILKTPPWASPRVPPLSRPPSIIQRRSAAHRSARTASPEGACALRAITMYSKLTQKFHVSLPSSTIDTVRLDRFLYAVATFADSCGVAGTFGMSSGCGRSEFSQTPNSS